MTLSAFKKIEEGLQEALLIARGAVPPYRIYPIMTERHRGAPTKIGDSHAPQKETPEER